MTSLLKLRGGVVLAGLPAALNLNLTSPNPKTLNTLKFGRAVVGFGVFDGFPHSFS